MKLPDLYKKLGFEAGFNEPIKLSTKNPFLKAALFLSEVLGKLPFNKYTRNLYKLSVNERIVEVPFVFQNLNLPKGSKILDFGCNRSKVAIELASLGYKVTGVDLLPYNYSHKNLEFIQGNFLEITLPSNSFDAVIAISSIEHSGLDYYGPPFPEGDKKVIDKIYKILKKEGIAIITVPYGAKYSESNRGRIYDKKTLLELFSNFKLLKEEYYLKNEQHSEWTFCSKHKLTQIINNMQNIVVCLVYLKER